MQGGQCGDEHERTRGGRERAAAGDQRAQPGDAAAQPRGHHRRGDHGDQVRGWARVRVTCGHVWCGRVELGEDQGEEQAVVLCCLSFTAGGILTVSPDFSWSGRPYRLEVARCTVSSLVTRVRRWGAGRCWSGALSTSAATWRPPASCGRPRCSTRSRYSVNYN